MAQPGRSATIFLASAAPSVSGNQMKQHLIRISLYCGVITFAVNCILTILNLPFLLLWTSNIIPGFVFGYILADVIKPNHDLRSFFFIILSGGLYILVAWIATGYSMFGKESYICFPIASIIGATLLLLLSSLLLDEIIVFELGLKDALLTGILSSILPVIGTLLEYKFDQLEWLNFILTFSIFIIWQPLYAWTISKQLGYR